MSINKLLPPRLQETTETRVNGHTNGQNHQPDVNLDDYNRILFSRPADATPVTRLTALDVSLVHTATSYLLTELGGPPSRDLIDGVIGAVLGSEKPVVYADIKLLQRIYSDSEANDDSLQKRLARDRQKLMKWQDANYIRILVYTEGGQTRDPITNKIITNLPTEWECPILPAIVQILSDATMDPDYDLDPDKAIRRTAQAVAKVERLKMPVAGKRTRRPRFRLALAHLIKAALGLIRKGIRGERDPDTAGLEAVGELVTMLRGETGVTLDQIFEHLRKLESLQVVEPVEPSRTDILSPPAPKNDAEPDSCPPENGPGDVPLKSIKKGDKTEPEGPQKEDALVGDALLCGPSSTDGHLPETETLEPLLGLELVTAELPRDKQAHRSLQVFTSRGYRHFFFRLEDRVRFTVRHKILNSLVALGTVVSWLEEGDSLEASFIVRPMWTGKPAEDLTPAELQADEAEVRPRPIHLDDLDRSRFGLLREYAALGFETSPDRYQVFLFVTAEKSVADAIRRRLVRGLNSDRGANGAFRLPGSRNFKPSRGGCDVRLLINTYDDSWTPAELEASGLLAPPEPQSQPHPLATWLAANDWKFPSWEKCDAESLADTRKDNGTVDYSNSDWRFSKLSNDWGIPILATLTELIRHRDEITPERLLKNPNYARRTVGRAYGINWRDLPGYKVSQRDEDSYAASDEANT
jgi:hypothetical protein